MRCALCSRPPVHWHHILPRQFLKREGYAGRMDDERNLMGLCWQHHMDHENWGAHGRSRITLEQLPDGVWDFARELGDFAVVRLERDYPRHERTADAARAHGA